MNRAENINNLLSYFVNIGIQNPDLEINKDLIYSNLIYYGCESSTQYSNKVNFENWIERFKNIPNIKVFNHFSHEYFCQFINYDSFDEVKNSNQIKVYIPLDSSHMYEGANMIFDYLASNNIKHASKIGSDYRFDSIVVRLFDEESAKLLENFINSNSFINEGLTSPNPFLINDNNIAMACDGLLSFNSINSSLIALYVNQIKEGKIIVNDNNFFNSYYSFINNLYNSYFENGTNDLNDLYFYFFKNHVDRDKEELLENLREIIHLISYSGDYTKTKEDFYTFFNYVNNDNAKTDNKNKISKLLYGNDNNINKEEVLMYAIKTTGNKYNSLQAIVALTEFLEGKGAGKFTNDNNCRVDLIDNLTPEETKEIICNTMGSLNINGFINYSYSYFGQRL